VHEVNYGQLFEDAVHAGQGRDYHTAIDIFTQIVSHTDRYPQSLLYLGRSYHALGQYNRAVLALEFYSKIFPESASGRFFLGRTYLALGNYESAIRNLRYAADNKPGFLPAQSFLGLAYLKIRNPDLAVRCFENALQIEPDNQRVFTGYLNALLVTFFDSSRSTETIPFSPTSTSGESIVSQVKTADLSITSTPQRDYHLVIQFSRC